MYIVVNQRLRKYLPKDFCTIDRDPLERTFGYTRQELDPDENIWAADVVVSGRGKGKKMAIALENARCGFRLVMDMPQEVMQPEADVFECRELMKERIAAAIQEEFLVFGIPKENVEDYIYNHSYEFTFVKAKPSFPSQNVSEFADNLQEEVKSGMVFEDIFSMGFNRTNRKFGNYREYRDVDMATYYMMRLTTEQAFAILMKRWEKIAGEKKNNDR